MIIPFTQYLRPNGQRRQVQWDTSNAIAVGFTSEIERKAQALLDAGCRFELEELSTGKVHMDCQTSDEDLLANALCNNNEDVPANVLMLVENAFNALSGGQQ